MEILRITKADLNEKNEYAASDTLNFDVSSEVEANLGAELLEAEVTVMSTYKVWMSAESTINATLEVEASSPEEAMQKARDFAQESKHKMHWYYEGSGDLFLDSDDCWSADVVQPPPPVKTPLERLRDQVQDKAFTVVTEKRHYRVFAGKDDITGSVANLLGIKTQMNAGKQKCDAEHLNPTTVAREVLDRLCEKLGREVGPVTIL